MTDSRKIAIYLRLSIEDDALDGKASTEQRESNSISNQRKMQGYDRGYVQRLRV